MEKDLNQHSQDNSPIRHPEERFDHLPKRLLAIGGYQDKRQKTLHDEQMSELKLLVDSYGAEVVDSEVIVLRGIDPATWMGKGKLQELANKRLELGAEGVVIDEELSPSQQRNLEEVFGCPVSDRTEIILAVFAHHARTKEAKIQIALAQASYLLPRLKRMWTHLSRQRGGAGVNQKGEGERQIEIDRRLLSKRKERYMQQLQQIQSQREVQNKARKKSGVPVVAIVGYTNAGKSTLLNSLTEAGVFVEDKLFATLDTTTRKFKLPDSDQEILLVDTVGFIRKLPHSLVAAFRSTLQQSTQADLLIHLVDGSSEALTQEVETTISVLEELGAKKIDRLVVINKIDRFTSDAQVLQAKFKAGANLAISAVTGDGLDELSSAITKALRSRRANLSVLIPHSMTELVSKAHELGQVSSKEYLAQGVQMDISIEHAHIYLFEKYLIE